MHWLGWDSFSKFWAQAVRWSMRSVETGDYQLTTSIESGEGKVVIDASREDQSVDFDSVLISPDLKRIPLRVRQTAPGRYEGTFEADRVGTYLVRAQPKDTQQILTGGISMSYSPEFRSWESNETLLYSLAEESGGTVLSGEEDVFVHNLPPASRSEPFWPLTMALALILLPADIFVRRVLLDWAMFKGLVADGWAWLSHALGLVWRRRPESDQTVDALLGVKKRLRSEERERKAAQEEDSRTPAAPRERKRSRLETLDALRSDADVMQATRGREGREPQQPSPEARPGDQTSAAKPASGMERLKEAKKRALRRKEKQ
jgi:hypothetical protein